MFYNQRKIKISRVGVGIGGLSPDEKLCKIEEKNLKN